MFTTEIKGGDRLDRALREMDRRLSRKVVNGSLRSGAKVIQAGAMQNAPVRTGALRAAIKVRSAKRRRGGNLAIVVGVGKQWFQGDQFYGAFQEFGWRAGKRRSQASVRERSETRPQIPGEHFVEYAFDERGRQAVETVIQDARKRINDLVGEVKF